MSFITIALRMMATHITVKNVPVHIRGNTLQGHTSKHVLINIINLMLSRSLKEDTSKVKRVGNFSESVDKELNRRKRLRTQSIALYNLESW